MTTPSKILAMDLVDLQKFQVRGYKYLLNAIDKIFVKNRHRGFEWF